ncbi:glycosyltransferase family 2 protein [Cobetia crustatorum]|uniref:glycosyltransferase family 2 protein n=1 Tax=Cobetia crustatorum TaxID=553385 RepID=UPI0004692F68|nr:glycosyltransferase family 2 protein [Cobetia crustatorum]
MHEVSFIMASFNCANYIERAISSALEQCNCKVELIIVDDASTDNTRDILDSLTDDRIKVIKLERNQGASHARNIAIASATHEWISILDSDDWCDQKRVSSLLKFAYINNVDIVADNQRLVDYRSGESLGVRSKRAEQFWQNNILTLEDVIKNSSIGIVQPIFKRSLLKDLDKHYDESLTYGEDYEFLVRLIESARRLGLVNQPYYNVTIRSDSLVASRVKMFQGMLEVFELLSKKQYIAESKKLSHYVNNNIQAAESTVAYGHVVESFRSKNFVNFLKYASRGSFLKQIPYRFYTLILKSSGHLFRVK